MKWFYPTITQHPERSDTNSMCSPNVECNEELCLHGMILPYKSLKEGINFDTAYDVLILTKVFVLLAML